MMHPNTKGPVVVLGGGLAGLSTLWHLQKAGYDNSFLFEKEHRVGGLARSEVVDGFTFDFTGHLLHFNRPEVERLVSAWLGNNLHFMSRDSWIFSKGVFTRYPFQCNLFGLPASVIQECLQAFMAAASDGKSSKDPSAASDFPSFHDWVFGSLGAGIARHFMVPYNEKLWTVPLTELTCEWMGRFVPVTSLEQVLQGTLSDSSQNMGYNATFGYPLRGGIEALPQALARGLSNVQTDCEVARLDLGRRIIQFSSGETLQYGALISSIPLPLMIRIASGVPSKVTEAVRKLRWVSVYSINLGVGRNFSDKHWIYFPEPEFVFYRAGFPHNFSPNQAPASCGAVYAEVSYSAWRPLDKSQVASQVKKDLIKAHLLRTDDLIMAENCLDIPWAYVLYDQDYRRNVDLVRSFVHECGILTIGRFGAWEYSGMEDAIWQGKLAAEGILNGYYGVSPVLG